MLHTEMEPSPSSMYGFLAQPGDILKSLFLMTPNLSNKKKDLMFSYFTSAKAILIIKVITVYNLYSYTLEIMFGIKMI